MAFSSMTGWKMDLRKVHVLLNVEIDMDMDVSKNRGTPKWMVYNVKPY